MTSASTSTNLTSADQQNAMLCGSPDTDCPFKANGVDVHYRFAELDLCPGCELVRRQVNNAHISDSLITRVNHWKNRHKDIYNLDTSQQ